MAYAVNLVALPEQAIASIRERGPLSAMAARVHRLRAALAGAGVQATGPLMARYFGQRSADGDMDFEVAVPILPGPDGSVPDRIGAAHGDLIPAHHAMVVRHRGPYGTLGEAHAALAAELDAVGYRLAGPITEVFLEGPAEGRRSADYLTEVRYPFAR